MDLACGISSAVSGVVLLHAAFRGPALMVALINLAIAITAYMLKDEACAWP
jgi:hypothetical protein